MAIVFDTLYTMGTEVNELDTPMVKVFSSRMMDDVLYRAEVIIKESYFYTQMKRTHLGIFLTRISLQKPIVPTNNVSTYSLWKLHEIQHIDKERAGQIILVALLENKQFINSLYGEGDSYVRRNVY